MILKGFDCPACAGDGCPACGGSGKMRVTGCVFDQVTEDVWDLMGAMADADHGNLPVSGGTLDQTRVFIDGLRLARRLEERCKAAHGGSL